MGTFPARVHAILARDAASAVIIRRGPSKSVCTIGWDRRTDRFTLGQWLRGRIYERRCDLSPDGKHFLYFAMNGKWQSETKGSWTAISRAPYLKAIGLWANGSCWNGGGLFVDNATYWLNVPVFGQNVMETPSHLRQTEQFPFRESYGGECPGVYYIQLQRDGWELVAFVKRKGTKTHTLFRKALGKGWILEKRAYETGNQPEGKGCYYDEHRLTNSDRGLVFDYPDWEWADWDRRRLVWAEKGALYAGRPMGHGVGSVIMLEDFNRMTFDRIQAPY